MKSIFKQLNKKSSKRNIKRKSKLINMKKNKIKNFVLYKTPKETSLNSEPRYKSLLPKTTAIKEVEDPDSESRHTL